MAHSSSNTHCKLSIIIPAFNEELRIEKTLQSMRSQLGTLVSDYEVIIVDDGSTDKTTQVVNQVIGAWPEYRCLTLPVNEGKGGAIRAGVLQCKGVDVLFMDADCSTDLAMIPKLYPYLTNEFPIVIGSRDLRGAEIITHQSFFREYSAKLFNLWIQFWLLPGIWDTQCGFKFFRAPIAKELFAPLDERRFGFDVEVLYRARKLGYKIKEVPVRWTNMLNSRVNPLRDGSAMAWQVLKLRLFGF